MHWNEPPPRLVKRRVWAARSALSASAPNCEVGTNPSDSRALGAEKLQLRKKAHRAHVAGGFNQRSGSGSGAAIRCSSFGSRASSRHASSKVSVRPSGKASFSATTRMSRARVWGLVSRLPTPRSAALEDEVVRVRDPRVGPNDQALFVRIQKVRGGGR